MSGAGMYRIDDDLKEFVESGVATIVGTGDAHGRPQMSLGWGPRVDDDRTVMQVFLDAAAGEAMVENLSANPRIAVTIAHPVSYRSVQFKGLVRQTGAPSEEERAWVRQQRGAFLTSTSLVGDPPETIRNMWSDDVVRVVFTVEQAFDQTPGPEAGKRL